ncbi:hypothetical protein [Marinitenerispora sediminis]|uniref:hypothetical protein n=1 Tax=Marinitenerispora sediminis TaxID=1931232 RepID=UPI001F30B626|nr:hypothetical protein [Marinitenerispora sediminis]
MVIGTVVVLAVIVVVTTLARGEPEEGQAAPSSETGSASADPGSVPSAGGDASVCGLDEVEMTGMLSTAPEGTQWELVGAVAVPSVEGAGPGRIEENGFRDCFARTPTGAVLAAANASILTGDPTLGEQAIERLIADGPGKDVALEGGGIAAESPGGESDISVQLAGFRMISYDGERANIQLAYNSSIGLEMVTPMDLVWEDGDWKAVLADNGEPAVPAYPVPDLAGFVRWAGA